MTVARRTATTTRRGRPRLGNRKPSQSAGAVVKPKGFIFDIDGTLALTGRGDEGYTALPGAVEAVSRLNATGIPISAFTNGTFHTPHHYRQILQSIGLVFPEGQVMTPAAVAADYFVERSIRRVLVLGREGVSGPLVDAGLQIVRPGDGLDGVQAVLVGWYPDFTFPDLDAACRAVWAGAALFTASNAPFFASRGGRILGISGAIVAMITSVTAQRAIVLGKPATHGLKLACAKMGLRPSEVAVVGDDPELEVGMARSAGARGIGILTGIADRAAFLAVPERRAAHFIFDTLTDFLDSGLLPGPADRKDQRHGPG